MNSMTKNYTGRDKQLQRSKGNWHRCRHNKAMVFLLLLGVSRTCFSQISLEPSLEPSQAVSITLPIPLPGYPELAGQSGFFLNRSAMEAAVLAMETIPLLRTQILKLETKGAEQAKSLDDKDKQIRDGTAIAVVSIIVALATGLLTGILIGGR